MKVIIKKIQNFKVNLEKNKINLIKIKKWNIIIIEIIISKMKEIIIISIKEIKMINIINIEIITIKKKKTIIIKIKEIKMIRIILSKLNSIKLNSIKLNSIKVIIITDST